MTRSGLDRRRRGSLPVWLAATAFLLAGRTSAPSAPGVSPEVTLAPGVALAIPVQAGERASFAADLTAGTAWRIAVAQAGADVVVEVRTPEGASLLAIDGPLERWGVEEILLQPEAAGRYTVEVRSENRGYGAGSVEILLEELPDSTPAERERIAALGARARAGAAFHGVKQGGLEPAAAALQEARDLSLRAGDGRGAAEAVTALAAVSRQLGRLRQAAELYREAAARWRELGEPVREVRAWNDLGLTGWDQSDADAAEAAFTRGLDLALSLGDAFQEADLRANQCLVVHSRGDLRSALDCYGESLARFRQLGEARSEATQHNNIGFASYSLGEPQPAEESYRQALEIRRAAGDRPGEAQALNNLAVLFRSLGEAGTALGFYREALEILATLDDRRQQASALNNLGVAYITLGELERARIYLDQALALRRAVEDRRGEIVTLNNFGWLEGTLGDLDKGIAYHRQALELARAAGDRRSEGLSSIYLGQALVAAGKPVATGALFDRALDLHRQAGDRYNESVALRAKGEALAAAGRPAEALPLLDQALALSRRMGNRGGEAAALTARAGARRDAGQLDGARGDADAAVAVLEALRTGLSSPDLRASFLGTRREAYELQVDVLMRLDAARPGQGFDRAAFEASDRARARALLDVLRGARPEIRNGAEPGLAARQRDFERRLALKAERRQSLLSRGPADRPEAKALELEIEQLTAELQALDAEIRRQSPRHADLTNPEAAGSRQIQALLDPGTLLLEYSLGPERSYLFVAGESSLRVFVLPGRGEIERGARGFYEAVSSPPGPGEAGRPHLGEDLARMLLGPAASELADHRLVIVPDGALHYVPFDVLPRPGASPPEPLLVRHEVVTVPSASALAAARDRLAAREPAPRRAIVFADPVFDAGDPRVARGGRPAPVAVEEERAENLARGSGPRSGLRFGRLRFSRQEAAAIAGLAAGEVEAELDFSASRDAVLSGRLRDYRYVHFATHGVFDAARPELSGLVLSRYDEAGRPREGFVGLRDVYELDLAADLVVLSGCHTALGREVRGEGLLGLTRGFLHAGAPRVVASLWWIDDRATATLMDRFYRGLWSEGLRPAEALRQARRALAAEHRFRDPFYWGAFVLQGDWR